MENSQLLRFLLIKQCQTLPDRHLLFWSGRGVNFMHPYMGKKAVLSTMHGKQQAIVQPFKKFLNISIQVPNKINTDVLGTFSGEIERELTPLKLFGKKQE